MTADALREIRKMVTDGQWDRGRAYDLIGDRETVMLMERATEGSLDAAKALHEALLPDDGWHVEWVAKYPNLAFKPAAWCASVGWGTRYAAYADDPARAWLIAIFDALIATETDDADQ